jgi:nitrilase
MTIGRSASLAVAVDAIGEAAAAGASLIVLSETFIPGYPSWMWRLAPGRDSALTGQLHTRPTRSIFPVATSIPCVQRRGRIV